MPSEQAADELNVAITFGSEDGEAIVGPEGDVFDDPDFAGGNDGIYQDNPQPDFQVFISQNESAGDIVVNESNCQAIIPFSEVDGKEIDQDFCQFFNNDTAK